MCPHRSRCRLLRRRRPRPLLLARPRDRLQQCVERPDQIEGTEVTRGPRPLPLCPAQRACDGGPGSRGPPGAAASPRRTLDKIR